MSYIPETATLHIRAGRILPVRSEVWTYEVCGMKIVKKWFGYRKKNPAGRRSSALDNVHSEEWSAEFTTALLQLLHLLTLCVELQLAQADYSGEICHRPLIVKAGLERAGVLPVSASARKPPAAEPQKLQPCCKRIRFRARSGSDVRNMGRQLWSLADTQTMRCRTERHQRVRPTIDRSCF
ncbi:type ISP restriction/modification enzyme [Nonomuraea sp. NPDC050328]|uniref:type ISP restriction/modification enzyme n=1 Tax=Nonomuraea sp. NPDC050328 TaxID=3364361 RepID=UPI0037A7BAEF